jgi:hypothetical protein
VSDRVRPDRTAVNKIFGAELPQESSDEPDVEHGAGADQRDNWLRDNVPPHHL